MPFFVRLWRRQTGSWPLLGMSRRILGLVLRRLLLLLLANRLVGSHVDTDAAFTVLGGVKRQKAVDWMGMRKNEAMLDAVALGSLIDFRRVTASSVSTGCRKLAAGSGLQRTSSFEIRVGTAVGPANGIQA